MYADSFHSPSPISALLPILLISLSRVHAFFAPPGPRIPSSTVNGPLKGL